MSRPSTKWRDTLDLIESLAPLVVIPGHGKVFTHVEQSLAAARRRLDGFVRDPMKHATHAAKVLLKFKLLELQRLSLAEFAQWANATAYFGMVHQRWFPELEQSAWIAQLAEDLVRSRRGAARRRVSAERLNESVWRKNKRPSIAAGPFGL